MSSVTGRSAKVEIGSGPTAIGKLIGNLQYEETDNAIDVTNGDSTAREYLALGLKGGSGSFQAIFDTADAGQDAVRLGMGTAQSLVVYPEGKTSGKMKLSGTVVITSLVKADADIEGTIKTTVAFTGVLTEGTAT